MKFKKKIGTTAVAMVQAEGGGADRRKEAKCRFWYPFCEGA